MIPFTTLDANAVPLAQANVDTDQIFPARFLQKDRLPGFGQFLFYDRRYNPDGSIQPDFVLNQGGFADAEILVADSNFGCGSSRENAVWVLQDAGFRAVLAPSFGDIFYNNCLKNGVLAVRLPHDVVTQLLTSISPVSNRRLQIDLPEQTVTLPSGQGVNFAINAFAKHCLVSGIDELDYTMSRADEIAAFERSHPY